MHLEIPHRQLIRIHLFKVSNANKAERWLELCYIEIFTDTDIISDIMDKVLPFLFLTIMKM